MFQLEEPHRHGEPASGDYPYGREQHLRGCFHHDYRVRCHQLSLEHGFSCGPHHGQHAGYLHGDGDGRERLYQHRIGERGGSRSAQCEDQRSYDLLSRWHHNHHRHGSFHLRVELRRGVAVGDGLLRGHLHGDGYRPIRLFFHKVCECHPGVSERLHPFRQPLPLSWTEHHVVCRG